MPPIENPQVVVLEGSTYVVTVGEAGPPGPNVVGGLPITITAPAEADMLQLLSGVWANVPALLTPAQATDLKDGGDSALHYHATDRARANHTGTQPMATISDAGTAALLTSDIDGTLAANSDARIATQKAVKTYVDTAVTGLLDFKGATDCSANPNYPAASKGDFYIVSVAGKIGGASGTVVEAGDAYYATANKDRKSVV